MLPVGTCNNIKIARVKVLNIKKSYCPKCKDIYKPKKKCRDIDGAFFGTSFPHILLMVIILILEFFRFFNKIVCKRICTKNLWI